ncbi:MAG: adenosylmethionine decarboxylase [Candidatus Obscuribacterales bacterium]|nr:adenosylmethionine decarboxylase [Candidatus Obscuribacterales bacterium]
MTENHDDYFGRKNDNAKTATSTLPVHSVYEAKGRHLLLTLEGCDLEFLSDEQFIRDLTFEAATASGATVLHVSSHKFEPHGVTAVAVLAESHASIHTYPESGVVFWDCFTCGDICKPELSIDPLVCKLSPSEVRHQIIERS